MGTKNFTQLTALTSAGAVDTSADLLLIGDASAGLIKTVSPDNLKVGNTGIYNVKQYGATGNGTTDDRAAIQACIDAAPSESQIFFPDGTYLIGSPGLVIDKAYMQLRGTGVLSTTVKANATSNGFILFKFKDAGSGVLYGCSLIDIGIKTNETTYTKTAIQLEDVANHQVDRVSVYNFYGTDSMGVRILGRQTITMRSMAITSNVPIRISENPAYASSRLSADHMAFSQMELISATTPSTLTWAGILVDNDTQLTNLECRETTFVGPDYGFYWNNASAAANPSYNVAFRNCRKEGGTNASAYSWYIVANATYPLYNLTLDNCTFEIDTGQGIYVSHVLSTRLVGCAAFGTTNTNCITAAAGCKTLILDGFYANNSTKSVSVQSDMLKIWSANRTSISIPYSGMWVANANASTPSSEIPWQIGRLHTWTWKGTLADDTSLEIFDNTAGAIKVATVTMSGSCAGGSPAAGGGVWHLAAKAIANNGVLLLSGTNADDADTDGNLICYSNTASLGGPVYIRNRLGATADIVLKVEMDRTTDL